MSACMSSACQVNTAHAAWVFTAAVQDFKMLTATFRHPCRQKELSCTLKRLCTSEIPVTVMSNTAIKNAAQGATGVLTAEGH